MRLSSTASILIVTQHLIIGADLTVQMCKFGYDVIVLCNSIMKCMKQMEKDLPDIVIIDITMKGIMDGIGLGEHIRIEYGIPVIFLNPGMGMDIIVSALRAEPLAILNVPYNAKQLQNYIELATHFTLTITTEEKDRMLTPLVII